MTPAHEHATRARVAYVNATWALMDALRAELNADSAHRETLEQHAPGSREELAARHAWREAVAIRLDATEDQDERRRVLDEALEALANEARGQ